MQVKSIAKNIIILLAIARSRPRVTLLHVIGSRAYGFVTQTGAGQRGSYMFDSWSR
jgi:hypothetical protein